MPGIKQENFINYSNCEIFSSLVKYKRSLYFINNKKLPNLKISNKKLSYQKISSKIDAQVLQQLPLYIKMEVVRKNKPLLIKDYDQLFDIARGVIRDFDSFERHYNDYMGYIKNGYKEKAVV